MTLLSNIARDLAEKRLWPLVVALVVALVGVPVALTRGGSDATTAAPAAPSARPAPATRASVTLDTTPPVRRDRGGPVHNPFAHAGAKAAGIATPTAAVPASPAPMQASASSSAPARSATVPATPAPSSTGGSTPPVATAAPTTGGPATSPKPAGTAKPQAEDAQDTYHVDLRLTAKGGTPKTIKDVARLSALPSLTDPFFVYLGVIETKAHRKRAVFLVSADATPNGEGACHPTKDDCESVELAVGQTAWFDLTAPDGTTTQYELELTALHRTVVRGEAKAKAAIARHSNAGAELLRDAAVRDVRAAAGARAYRYVPATGLLERAKRRHVTAKAAAAGALIPGLALVASTHQPGIPVWHAPPGK